MCKAVEEYAKEREEKSKLETIKNMLKKNISLEVALECTGIDKATYEKYSEQFGRSKKNYLPVGVRVLPRFCPELVKKTRNFTWLQVGEYCSEAA